MEVVGGAHGLDDDIGERTGIETFDLDVITERGEVTIECSEFGACSVIV